MVTTCTDCRVRSSGVDVDYRSQRNETPGAEPCELKGCGTGLLGCPVARCCHATPLRSMKVQKKLFILLTFQALKPRFYDLQLNVRDESGAEITSLEDDAMEHGFKLVFLHGCFRSVVSCQCSLATHQPIHCFQALHPLVCCISLSCPNACLHSLDP